MTNSGKPKLKFQGIKKASEYRRGELARDVLRVAAAGLVVGSAIVAPNMPQIIDYFDPRGVAERRRIWRAIKYLEERNSIEIRRAGGHEKVFLTKRGKVQLDEESVWDLEIRKPWRWDHKWRLVMFDFPARFERVRRPFRDKLTDFGLVSYQKSIFIYPYECQEEILTLAEFYGVRDYVRYIVAEEISNMREIAKRFDLI
jgi:DNA-binding transcriptional regulator PaaX